MSDHGKTSHIDRLDTGVVIIGGGGAGLAAAVAAAEKGANVIVLEKRRVAGGNSVFAEGFFAAESPAQKRMRIDARRDELFKIAMDYSHWTINPRIIRAFINKSGNTVQWLEEKGLKIDAIPPLYPNQVPLVWHCVKKRGAGVIKLLLKNCEDLGVRLLYETATKRILTNEKGHATGVIAVTKEKELKITAKSVIIATGGYAGNKKLLKKYYPHYTEEIKCAGLPHMGDGLLMAQEIGADSEGLGILQITGPGVPRSLHLTAVVMEPNTIWLNKNGERFANETAASNDFESGNSLLRQPDKVAYAIFDEKVKQGMIKKGLIHGLGHYIVPTGSRLTELEKELRSQVANGRVQISDSWADIARWIGATPDILKATIAEYNAFCDQGYDEIFAKDRRYLVPLRTPPYYAIKCYPGFLGTIGGIKINHRMEVINLHGEPIPGVYAAGVDTGGWESDTYCAILSGSTFGFALNSGRIAGENAAKCVSENVK